MFDATGIDKLGQWPILQFAAAVLIVLGVAYMMLRGLRDKESPPTPAGSQHEQLWYFDGPLHQALRELSGVYREIKEMRTAINDFIKERRAQHERQMVERREQHDEHMEAVRDLKAELEERLPSRHRRS